jgi:hypothetical protein
LPQQIGTIAPEGADIEPRSCRHMGPFVVEPGQERKIELLTTALSIDASSWRNSDWAKKKRFVEVHPNVAPLDPVRRLAIPSTF